jgi:hypothetical protein
MTLPYERTRAVLETEQFLIRLITPKVTPGLPKLIRQQAKSLLRHYPGRSDFAVVSNGWEDKFVHVMIECPFAHPDKKGFTND